MEFVQFLLIKKQNAKFDRITRVSIYPKIGNFFTHTQVTDFPESLNAVMRSKWGMRENKFSKLA